MSEFKLTTRLEHWFTEALVLSMKKLGHWMCGWKDGWIDAWVDGRMDVKAGLRIAYSNQKYLFYLDSCNQSKTIFIASEGD